MNGEDRRITFFQQLLDLSHLDPGLDPVPLVERALALLLEATSIDHVLLELQSVTEPERLENDHPANWCAMCKAGCQVLFHVSRELCYVNKDCFSGGFSGSDKHVARIGLRICGYVCEQLSDLY
jgi:hypothetical protein